VSDIVQMVIAARTICGDDPKVAAEESWAVYDRVMARHEAAEAIQRIKDKRNDRRDFCIFAGCILAVVILWALAMAALLSAL